MKKKILFSLLCLLGICGVQNVKADFLFASLSGDEKTVRIEYNSNPPVGYQKDWSVWNSDNGYAVTKIIIYPDVNNCPLTSTARWFKNFRDVETIEGLDNLNTHDVTDMSEMFHECRSLSSLDVSSFDAQNVTNMVRMFYDCRSLTALDLRSFVTKKVINMSEMFDYCLKLESIKFREGYFNTSNVSSMAGMFKDCQSLKSIDVSMFNTSNVTSMREMFEHCKALTELDLVRFDMSSIVTVEQMFNGCTALETIFCNDNWKTSETIEGDKMFYDCTSLKGREGAEYNNANTGLTMAHPDNAEDHGYFTPAPLEIYCVKDAQTLYVWYGYNYKTDNHLSDFTSSKGHEIKRLSIRPSVADWKPTSLESWLNDFTKLKIIEGLEYLNTSEVENMIHMFQNCESLTELDLTTFNTEKVKDMSWMFSQCFALESVDVTSFRTPELTNASAMFDVCESLKTLDLRRWDMSKVEDVSNMFYNCALLENILVDVDWAKEGLKSDNMFFGCTSLEGSRGTKYDDANPKDATYAHPDEGELNPGYFVYSPKGLFASRDGNVVNVYYDYRKSSYDKAVLTDFNSASGYDIEKIVFEESVKEAPARNNAVSLFSGFESLTEIQGLEYLDFSEATAFNGMFQNCKALESIDLGSLDGAKIHDAQSMFAGCEKLKAIDLSKITFTDIANLAGFFEGCAALEDITFGESFGGYMKTLANMFKGCTKLASIDLSSFHTASVNSMVSAFEGCESLTSLDIRSFDFTSATDISNMFKDCSSLKEIICDEELKKDGRKSDNMFDGCVALIGGKGTSYSASNKDANYARPDRATKGKPGYFTAKQIIKVEFRDWDETSLYKEDVLIFDDAVGPTTDPTREGYTFFDWDKELTEIKVDVVIRAMYEINKYTVSFVDKDGKAIGEPQIIEWNTAAKAPEAPAVEGHTFAGWDQEFDHVKSDLTVKATYTTDLFKLTLVAENGKIAITPAGTDPEKVPYGTKLTLTAIPDEGYEFDAWTNYDAKEGLTVKDNVTVTAAFKLKTFNVSFIDDDDKLIGEVQVVEWDKAATAPKDDKVPAPTGYHFTGWDRSFDHVKADITVKAQYEINTYEVKLVAENGKIEVEPSAIDLKHVEHGKVLSLTAVPNEGYVFDKWINTTGMPSITQDTTFTSVFKLQHFTVIFCNYDGTRLSEDQIVEWGKAAVAPEEPTREGWTFAGWDKPFNAIKSNIIVSAQFTKNPVFTVSFQDFDKSVIAEVKVEEGKAAVAPSDPTREGYTFAGWDKKFDEVTEDIVVTAQYTKNAEFTVTFKDYDGTVLKEEKVEIGKDATAPEAPSRTGYTFAGWDKGFSEIKEDRTVTAQYTARTYPVNIVIINGKGSVTVEPKDIDINHVPYGTKLTLTAVPEEGYKFYKWKNYDPAEGLTVNGPKNIEVEFEVLQYHVRFFNWDEMIISSQYVDWGKDAIAPVDPTRENYTFTGWDKEFTNIKADLDVKAQFAINTHTVLFQDFDGKQIGEKQTIEHGKAATAPSDPTREGYTFTGWDKAFDKVTEDLTVTATYTIKSYTVTFLDWNADVLSEQLIEHGKAAKTPKEPVRTGWIFAGWDKPYNNITEDLIVVAQYSKNPVFTVTFVDWDEKVISKVVVEKEQEAIAPSDPTREGYTFTGWDKAFDKVTEDITVTAQYAINTYKVRFYDGNGNPLKTEDVKYGEAATAPEAPEVEGMKFIGWSDPFDKVTCDKWIVAYYEDLVFTVQFVDWDGKLLKEEIVVWNQCADGPYASMTREGYYFDGWDKDYCSVKSDLVLTAVYKINTYEVTFYDWLYTEIKTEEVEHGKAATAPKVEDMPEHVGYHFVKWDKDFSKVTEALYIYPIYEVNVYTVTFKDWDGTVLSEQKVNYNESALSPADPTRKYYTFDGWDKDFDNVKEDLVVTAEYTAIDTKPLFPSVNIFDVEGDFIYSFSWLPGEQADSYELRLATGGKDFASVNTAGQNQVVLKLSDIVKLYSIKPGTYTINWFVRSTDDKGTAISDWVEGAEFEVTVKAPGPGTGVENIQHSEVSIQKVLRDGKVYILVGDRMYDATGRMVK